MATHRPSFAVPLADFAVSLLAQRELAPRAQVTADQVLALLPDSAVVVYVVDDQAAPGWSARGIAGEIELAERVVDFEAGTLGQLAARREPFLLPASELKREDYAHLNIRRTLQSLAYLPILADDMLVGGVEIISFDQPLPESMLHPLTELSEYAAIGIALAMVYENERNAQLESISRLTQLYDLEKVFNATLELDLLLPIITQKFREILNVQAVNLWLVDGDAMLLISRNGTDETVEVGARINQGGGIAFEVSEKAEAVVIAPDDPRIAARNQQAENYPIQSMLAAPVVSHGKLVGVVEVINKLDGTVLEDDDLFLLINVTDAAAGALHNAALLETERKVEILETLVSVSRELASTLNLERVLQAVVNGPNAVIPYERAAIALDDSGRLKLKAISGVTEIKPGDPDATRLSDILQWCSLSDREIHITQKDGEINDTRAETRAKFERYFEQSGMRGFFALPLADDQGRVGILSFESSDPDFLSQTHREMIKILAGQATVALRNAAMYKEVPFIGVLEPLIQRKQKFMAMEKSRRAVRIGIAAAALVFLVAFPLPMRLGGNATVAPARTAKVQPEVEGVVKTVLVREGQAVARGEVIAELESWEYAGALAAAEAKHRAALAEANRALAANDSSTAGVKRVEAEFWAAETGRARERLQRTRLTAPIDGLVATAHIENLVGTHLTTDDVFAEIVDTSQAMIDVGIEESEVALLRAGANSAVKLESYPTRTFRGQVEIVSPAGSTAGDHRLFFARVKVPNPAGAIRPGMQGNAKVSVGWRPAGYVLFRGLGRWAWGKLWNWFGW